MAWLAAINDGVGNMAGIASDKIMAGNSDGFALEIDGPNVGFRCHKDDVTVQGYVDGLLNR